MKVLFQFLSTYKKLFIFLLLSISSLLILTSKDINKKVHKHLNSAQYLVGNTYSFFHTIHQYSAIKKAYEAALEENATLKASLAQVLDLHKSDTLLSIKNPHQNLLLIPAQVVNNTAMFTKNYLTINKGIKDGIHAGMGVISKKGVVGMVKFVSDHFATVISLLHVDWLVSAKVGVSGTIGTVCWPGIHPCKGNLLYVPRHLSVHIGDNIVTSGYSGAFYEGIPIGKISQIKLTESSLFYDIEVDFITDFNSLHYVYVIVNQYQFEKDSLENITRSYYE